MCAGMAGGEGDALSKKRAAVHAGSAGRSMQAVGAPSPSHAAPQLGEWHPLL